MGATFSRIKDWVAEVLTFSDLNAEIDNILTNLTPTGLDDYSATLAQMKLQVTPGGLGTESLANSMAGEIERLRFTINRITGETYWYETPTSSIAELSASLGGGLTSNRIASGRSVSGTTQPIFLTPHGTNRTVTLKGSVTPFVYYIAGVQYTISTDVTSGTLSAAPSTNNTCLVNSSALSGQEYTRTLGEYETEIPVDTMGSEISALVGKFAAFKVGTEYFIARVESATQLTKAWRGYFYDSTDAALSRVTLSDNATITLQKLTWVFAKTDGTLTQAYNVPYVSLDQPTSPAIGDYWFDLAADIWKYTLDGSTFVSAGALLVGVATQDTTGAKAARSFDVFKNYATTNTIEIERASNTTVRSKRPAGEISVYGETKRLQPDTILWDITLDLDSGVTESASKVYYLYIKENGDKIISDVAPHDRQDTLKGRYHTHQSARAVGEFFNDASSNIAYAISYNQPGTALALTAKTAAYTTAPNDKVVLVNATSGAISVTLHSAANRKGDEIIVAKTDSSANTVTVDPTGTETINGSLTFILSQNREMVTVISDGTNWLIRGARKAPTVQSFTSSSGTYTTPNGVQYIRVRAVGSGGGGGGSGTSGSGGNGTTGTDTTFGSSLITCFAGASGEGGTASAPTAGAGGTASTGAGAVGIAYRGNPGGTGGSQSAGAAASNFHVHAGAGGASIFGGAGRAPGTNNNAVGGSADANTGSGGSGGGMTAANSVSNRTGAGGGAGGYVDAIIYSPAATYAYVVGAAGSGGTGGGGGSGGGNGGTGFIIVEEYY